MINISIGEWPKNSGIKSYSQRVFKLEQSQKIVAVSLLLQSNVIATNACSVEEFVAIILLFKL